MYLCSSVGRLFYDNESESGLPFVNDRHYYPFFVFIYRKQNLFHLFKRINLIYHCHLCLLWTQNSIRKTYLFLRLAHSQYIHVLLREQFSNQGFHLIKRNTVNFSDFQLRVENLFVFYIMFSN